MAIARRGRDLKTVTTNPRRRRIFAHPSSLEKRRVERDEMGTPRREVSAAPASVHQQRHPTASSTAACFSSEEG